jgi:single-strand DNA-binding protein
MDTNVCTFTGRITKDAESKMIGETEVGRYSIAVNGRKDRVMFLDCDHWRIGGVLEYLIKGCQVCVTGELDQQSWEKDGQKKTKMVLNVRNLTLLGAGKRPEPQEEFASF